MTAIPLPDLTAYEAVLFDLDGVLTPTAEVHMRAWRTMFEELFRDERIEPPYTEDDYFAHLDGRKRYDGVAALLHSRGIERPWGDPADSASADTICGIGNRKNAVFSRVLHEGGIAPYPGSMRLLDVLQDAGVRVAVVSSSKNARDVLQTAGIESRFDVIMDGVLAERDRLPSKPAPDVFLEAARMLDVTPSGSVAVEDAVSGVESAAAADFGLVVGVDRGAGEQALRRAGADVVVSDLYAFVSPPDSTTPDRGRETR